MPFAVEFSVCMGVADCEWPILWRVAQIGPAYWTFCKRDPTSDYVAYPITFLIMFDTVCTALFVSLVFLNFLTPRRSDLLLCCRP